MSLCVSWLDGYEATVFSSNGRLNRVTTELLSFALNMTNSGGLGWNPRASVSHRLADVLELSHSLCCDPSGQHLKGEGPTLGLSFRGVGQEGVAEVIAHDRKQRRTSLGGVQLPSPSAPCVPPGALAHGMVSPMFKMSVSFWNIPTHTPTKCALPLEVTLKPIKLTIKINHYNWKGGDMYFGSWF